MRNLYLLLAITISLPLLSSVAAAQTSTSGEEKSLASSTAAALPQLGAKNQGLLASFASLPEAETLIFINTKRILNEALPKVLPEKDVTNMRQAFTDLKQLVGVDLSQIDYVLLAMRYPKPSASLDFVPPEFMILASGDLSAESLILLSRLATEGKLRDETYQHKTIALFTIESIAREAQKNPILKSLSEVAMVSLNANTIAIGTEGYLKAAIDADQGTRRISEESINSLLRDPNALISVAGSPLTSFRKSFGLLGTEATPRQSTCDSKFGDFYAALTMNGTNFMIQGALHADNPDTAKIINSLITGLIRQAAGAIPDPQAQSVLKAVSLSPEGDEVVLRANIAEQTVRDFIKRESERKATAATATKVPKSNAPARRRTRSRKARP